MRKWIPAALTVIAFGVSLAVYSQLPERMAIHWGMEGQPNGWASRTFGAFGLPGMMLMFTVLIRVLPSADPLTDNYDKFRPSYDIIGISAVTLCLAVHLVSLGIALGFSVPVQRIAPALVGVFLICLGNVLPRLRANSWVGIRTPWSVSDDANWSRTQRIGGYLLVASGFAWIGLAAMPGTWMTRIVIGSTVVAVVASYVSSVIAES